MSGESIDATAVLQMLKDFGVNNLPTKEDLKAVEGNVDVVYATNNFADHYLDDYFAAGRMRTPP